MTTKELEQNLEACIEEYAQDMITVTDARNNMPSFFERASEHIVRLTHRRSGELIVANKAQLIELVNKAIEMTQVRTLDDHPGLGPILRDPIKAKTSPKPVFTRPEISEHMLKAAQIK